MASNDVFMDTNAIPDIARRLDTSAQVLKTIDKALEASINILRTTAFVGLVSSSAFERYLLAIQPQIRELIDHCEEMSHDLKAAYQQFLDGDASSGRYL
jgi:hypothetical protein